MAGLKCTWIYADEAGQAHADEVLEVEVGDGGVHRFGPGSIVLLEDTSGQGHRTRVVGSAPVVGVFLAVP